MENLVDPFIAGTTGSEPKLLSVSVVRFHCFTFSKVPLGDKHLYESDLGYQAQQ